MKAEYPTSAMRFMGSVEIEHVENEPPKVKMLARSGQPIEHWYWGTVVHDNSGAKFGDSIPLDYCHDDKEVVGFANRDGIGLDDENNLTVSGTMTPFSEGDRASEILAKSKMGVPYQASINFAGDGIKLQNVKEGEATEVNGYQFNGPGVVIREWPLRGIAVCPYGADGNTKSEFSTSDVISVTVLEEPMSDQTTNETSEAVEEVTLETASNETEQAVTAVPEVAEFSNPVAMAKKFAAEFGNEKCGEYLSQGLTFSEAQAKFSAYLKDENEKLTAKIAHLQNSSSEAVSGGAEAEEVKEAKTFASVIRFANSSN